MAISKHASKGAKNTYEEATFTLAVAVAQLLPLVDRRKPEAQFAAQALEEVDEMLEGRPCAVTRGAP